MLSAKFRLAFIAVAAAAAMPIVTTAAYAESCYDLWYERNQIYDDNGFCFETELGQQTFDNSDCYTSNPKLTKSEQKRVAQIKAEEKRRHCKVNN